MGLISTWRAISRHGKDAYAARERGDHAALADLIRTLHAERAPQDAIAVVMREAKGITDHGVPEAVAAVLGDQDAPKVARRNAAHVLGTMPCAPAREALRAAADGSDPDSGMVDQAKDALQALRV